MDQYLHIFIMRPVKTFLLGLATEDIIIQVISYHDYITFITVINCSHLISTAPVLVFVLNHQQYNNVPRSENPNT